jgi:hypothetical protein
MRVWGRERLAGADFRGFARRGLPFGPFGDWALWAADGTGRFEAAASKTKVSCSPMPITPRFLARG